MQDLVFLEIANLHADLVGDVGDQAFHFEFLQAGPQHAAVGDALGRAAKFDLHVHFYEFRQVDAG